MSIQFLAKHLIPVFPHPPYSPDLSPPESFLFPTLKMIPKGERHQSVQDIIASTTNELTVIPQTSVNNINSGALLLKAITLKGINVSTLRLEKVIIQELSEQTS
jgi:hypothetical protein